jgi:hypothetical protein
MCWLLRAQAGLCGGKRALKGIERRGEVVQRAWVAELNF